MTIDPLRYVTPMPSQEERIDAVVHRLGEVNGKVDTIQRTVVDVNAGIAELRSAVAQMARLEVRHDASTVLVDEVRRDLKALDERVDGIEKELPLLRKGNAALEKVAWIVATAVILAILGLVLVKT